ncbi:MULTISPECIES: hypothetical protein [unclassified Anabaena]|uniref:hypothetical protein n=1 Tax=unclassified Anabaena TaxID=2619674 RepID=UPI0014455A3C|nr:MULTISPECIES: hypothetical protein [unclassified Anabaena]MTJ10532.1 hypothetical protein [Anabaena sp. UHCC 0204]MTJ55071.1 hypothetical protein [Anabaena sp. UHCC 0253]
MIHHLSISAQNPQRVAEVLAEVMNGKVIPFPSHPGSYMMIALDEHGTAIEVYPLQTELQPGEKEDNFQFKETSQTINFTATHAAISVDSNQEKIEAIANREGWRVTRCNRDSFFDVIEFWLENRIMIEFLTPDMVNQYLKLMQSAKLQKA